MVEKEQAKKEFMQYEKVRDDFYALLDKNIPLLPNSTSYDFSKANTLNAKDVYELFFALDYQARKIRGLAVNMLNEK